MRERACKICKEIFSYKNKSKRYCSNACKQQALRDREKVKLLKVTEPQVRPTYNTEIINQVLKISIEQVEAMCKGMSIHHSIVSFMQEMVQVLKIAAPKDSKLRNQLDQLKEVMKTLYKYSQNNQCEYGYITFNNDLSNQTRHKLNQIKKWRKITTHQN